MSSKNDKYMAVPMDELLEIIEKLGSLSFFVEEVMSDWFEDSDSDRQKLATLSEYYSGCSRIREYVFDILSRPSPSDLGDAKVPENSVPIKDADYLLLSNMLVGMLSLQVDLLDRNISLNIH